MLGEPFLFKITNNTPELGRDIVRDWDVWNGQLTERRQICLLYTSDAADEEDSVDLGGRRIIKKKKER